ncbi:MAG TPA: sigma-70 family RNA polymerase sigma factor [Segetibacter sp.]|nr:sigma-70 family RNA polymerase sigma factor [Segetibacter sp.]
MVSYRLLGETEIIDRVVNGDVAVFEVLIRRYNPYLYKVGRSYNSNHQDVEDLMQETFINAYLNLSKLENKLYFKTWLVKIMLNECYRKKHKLASSNEVVTDTYTYEKNSPMFSDNSNSDTGKKVGNRELNNVIENALKQIPTDYRMVFCLREMNGMSVYETSQALHITETNVKVRLNRAKAMLRKEVEKMYSADEIFEFNLVYCDAIVTKVMDRISKIKKIST